MISSVERPRFVQRLKGILRKEEPFIDELQKYGFFAHLAARDITTGKLQNSPPLTPDNLRDQIINMRDLSMFEELFSAAPNTQEFGIRLMDLGKGRVGLEISRNMNNKQGGEVYFYTGVVGMTKDINWLSGFMAREFAGEEMKIIRAGSEFESPIKIFKEKEDVENCLTAFCELLDGQSMEGNVAPARARQLVGYVNAIKERGLLKNNEKFIMNSNLIVENGKVYGVDMINGRKRDITELARSEAEQRQAEELKRHILDLKPGESFAYAPKSIGGLSTISQGKRAINVITKDKNGNVNVKIAYAPPGTTDEQLLRILKRLEDNEIKGEFMLLNSPATYSQMAQAIINELGIEGSPYAAKLLAQSREIGRTEFIPPPEIKSPIIFLPNIFPSQSNRSDTSWFNFLPQYPNNPSPDSSPHDSATRQIPQDRILDFSTIIFLGSTTSLFMDSDMSLPVAAAIDFPQTALIRKTEFDEIDSGKDDTGKVEIDERKLIFKYSLLGLIVEEESKPCPTGSPAYLELSRETTQTSINYSRNEKQEIDNRTTQTIRSKMKDVSHAVEVKVSRVKKEDANDLVAVGTRMNNKNGKMNVVHEVQSTEAICYHDLDHDSKRGKKMKDAPKLVGAEMEERAIKKTDWEEERLTLEKLLTKLSSTEVSSAEVLDDQFIDISENVSNSTQNVDRVIARDSERGYMPDAWQSSTNSVKVGNEDRGDIVVERKLLPLLTFVTPPKIFIDQHFGERIGNWQEIEARRIWEMFLRIYFGIRADAGVHEFAKDEISKIVAIQEIAKKNNVGQFWQITQYAQLLGILLICLLNYYS